MSWGLIFNILVAVGGLAGISSLLNTLLSNKRVRAEAADIEQTISDKVLKNVSADNDKLRGERDELIKEIANIKQTALATQQRMEAYEWEQHETRMLVVRLINWARRAHEELKYHGSEMEPPPMNDLVTRFKIENKP